MVSPSFWNAPQPDWRARLLRPLAAAYGAAAAHRLRHAGARVHAKVITVGNFTAGGAGKTPLALALAAMARDMRLKTAFLTRGYGGDESALLARCAPVFEGADRLASAQQAIAQGADLLICDDGLQSRRIEPDLALCAVDGAVGEGNGLCLPAGPLRAPLDAQWPLVDALVVIGAGAPGAKLTQAAALHARPAIAAEFQPAGATLDLRGARVLAFAGIGRPEKFFATLRAAGAHVVATRPFADHHRYTPRELALLHAEAAREKAQLATTEKDFARLTADQRADIVAAPVALVFSDEEAMRLRALVHQKLQL
ncbi:MAG: tetraacyldisaccharide 4'-kinase [Hyphomicrobiales bacterium]|nr:tetraacyldisaccharide 4'-kinase [Hyphomicrobiales bacterium]